MAHASAFLVAAAAAAAGLAHAAAQAPGIAASISSTGANYVLNQFIPIIEVRL
jgi:hypothetical protein